MGMEQLTAFKCDYCKAREMYVHPVAEAQTRHWVFMRLTRMVEGKAEVVNLSFDSAKCAAQALKLLSEDKAVITKGKPGELGHEEPPQETKSEATQAEQVSS